MTALHILFIIGDEILDMLINQKKLIEEKNSYHINLIK